MSFLVTPGELNRRGEFFTQIGGMIAAGVPLVKALEMSRTAGGNRALGGAMNRLLEELHSGHTFSTSLSRIPCNLSDFDLALLSVGEESGRLDASFKLLGEYYVTRAKIIRDTIAGLAQTVVTFNFFLLIFPLKLLTDFAVNGIMNNDSAQCIPFIVEKVIAFGTLYGTILFFIFACQSQRAPVWRGLVENIFQIVPLLGKALKYLALSRLTAALHALTNAGVNVVKSWELSASAAGSEQLRQEIAGWREKIDQGMTPGDLVSQTRYFPEMFANLFHTGEVSGKQDETLSRLHTYYQEEGFRTLRLFTKILNGVIYGTVVIVVAYSIIKFYTGYYANAMKQF